MRCCVWKCLALFGIAKHSVFFFFLLIRIVVSNICWVKGRMINCFTFESHVGTFVGSSVLGTGINNDDKKEHVVLKEFTG